MGVKRSKKTPLYAYSKIKYPKINETDNSANNPSHDIRAEKKQVKKIISEKSVEFNLEKLTLAEGLLITLFHPLRLFIMEFIDRNKEVTVTQIYKALNIEQAVASQHLARMQKFQFVKARREGHFVFYSLNYERIGQIMKTLEKHFIN